MLNKVFSLVKKLFDKAKFYEAGSPVQSGTFIDFEGVSFDGLQANYDFKLFVVGNTLNKDSKGVLPQCDELLEVLEANNANVLESHPSKIRVRSVMRVNVREGLFSYEIAFTIEVRLLRGV